MVILALLSATVSTFTPHAGGHGLGNGLGTAGTTVLAYLLGWRARDRAAGVIAGLLLATSLPFAAHVAAAPRDAIFALLTVAALFSFVAGSSLLALAFAGLATVARLDGLPLGLVLLALSLAQRRRWAPLGGLTFSIIAALGWAALTWLGHERLPSLHIGPRDWLLMWAVAPGMAFVTWLLLPFCAELGEAARRARWLPALLWAAVYVIAGSFVRFGDREATEFVLMPVWFLLAAGGLSRLLPALTGEIPLPWVRYLLAALAVLSLLAMRLRVEWPLPQPPAVVRAPAPAPAPPAAITPAAVAVPAAAATVAALHAKPSPVPPHLAAPPKPAAVVKPPPKPQPKPAANKAAAVPKPRPITRPRAIYRRPYRPRQAYRHYYRRH